LPQCDNNDLEAYF